jgi:hypothetical protein
VRRFPYPRLAAAAASSLALGLLLAPAAAADHARNPCLGDQASTRLKCPDLRMRPPFDIQLDRSGGRNLLRAANSIDSVGRGPAELRGRRVSRRAMDARQRIYLRGGGRKSIATHARLYFKHIPGQGGYWKFRNAARFELWRLNREGERVKLVRTGPKQVYCLRDLEHTRPGLKGSPAGPVYPSCNQNRSKRRETLGTSVGWSDVYPAGYHEQWIDVTNVGRRGCYAYVHVVDPRDRVYERREGNNEASTVVRLTSGGGFRGICDRRDRGVRAAQQGDGSAPPGVAESPDEDPDGYQHPGGYEQPGEEYEGY